MHLIEVKNLHKSFDNKKILHNLNFTVEKGGIFAFLGPNGAGKTTTLRLLLGLLTPDQGHAHVFNKNLSNSPDLRRRIGILLETDGCYDRLSAYDNLAYFADLYQVPNPTKRIQETLEKIELTSRAQDLVGNYSTGMRRRLGLGRALLHNPEILFLDEPTLGLDPKAQKEFRDLILHLSQKTQTTVFLNTHDLDEVERIATEVAILRQGRLVLHKKMQDFRAEQENSQKHQTIITITFKTPQDTKKALPLLEKMPETQKCTAKSESITCLLHPGKTNLSLHPLITAGLEVEEFKKSRPTLEQAFLELTSNPSEND